MRLTRTVPEGACQRLVEHYGPSVHGWLHDIESTIATTASRLGISVHGFHDAGWTSVIAVGDLPSGQAVALKAVADPDRYHHERAALAHWGGYGASRLLTSDDTSQILVTALVGGAAGGAPHPADDTERVAKALPRLHEMDVDPGSTVPTLRGYYRHTVLPRIEQRAERFGATLDEHTVQRALEAGDDLCAEPHQPSMLHADLYAENLLFDSDRAPVFIDPHPKIGSPAFDWAFWCVYYRQDDQFGTRVDLCRQQVPELAEEMLAWSLTLAVDGSLYYLDTEDPRIEDMHTVLQSLLSM